MAIAKQKNPERYVNELQKLVLQRFPNARFRTTDIPGDDVGTALWTYVNGDAEDVRELVSNREVEILVDHDIDIMTIPMPLKDWQE